MPKIVGWPEVAGRFDGPALFHLGMHNAVAALKQLLDPASGQGEEPGRKVARGG